MNNKSSQELEVTNQSIAESKKLIKIAYNEFKKRRFIFEKKNGSEFYLNKEKSLIKHVYLFYKF